MKQVQSPLLSFPSSLIKNIALEILDIFPSNDQDRAEKGNHFRFHGQGGLYAN